MTKVDHVIIGGGFAGLCAARRLIELGVKPFVIEAGTYPSHKVCGEFISPSSLILLNHWNIYPILIAEAHLHTCSDTLKFKFSPPAGSLSHLTLDTQLAHQISELGGTILTQTKVQDLSPARNENSFHTLQLSSGQTLLAKHLFIATGRLPGLNNKKMPPCYKGFKSHFSGIELNSTLHMFSFPGIYLGISPVENGWANLACLAKIDKIQNLSATQFMKSVINKHPFLKHLLDRGNNLFNDWMEVDISKFGLRSPPHWPHTYWIGDSASTIPPASGNGLSLALASGYLAAQFAIQDDAIGFRQMWKKRCYQQILAGKGLHYFMSHPFLANQVIRMNHYFPFLAKSFFSITRDSGFKEL